jgi:hypothetical protein
VTLTLLSHGDLVASEVRTHWQRLTETAGRAARRPRRRRRPLAASTSDSVTKAGCRGGLTGRLPVRPAHWHGPGRTSESVTVPVRGRRSLLRPPQRRGRPVTVSLSPAPEYDSGRGRLVTWKPA